MKRKFYVKPSLVLYYTEVQPLMSASFKSSSTEAVGKTVYDWDAQDESSENGESDF